LASNSQALRALNNGLDGRLLNILQYLNDPLPAALNQAQYRRLSLISVPRPEAPFNR
jgi:hypothetical protein